LRFGGAGLEGMAKRGLGLVRGVLEARGLHRERGEHGAGVTVLRVRAVGLGQRHDLEEGAHGGATLALASLQDGLRHPERAGHVSTLRGRLDARRAYAPETLPRGHEIPLPEAPGSLGETHLGREEGVVECPGLAAERQIERAGLERGLRR